MSTWRPENQGVDLNRNWDIEWDNKEKDPGTYDKESSEYHGTAPRSEPESKVLKAFLDKH